MKIFQYSYVAMSTSKTHGGIIFAEDEVDATLVLRRHLLENESDHPSSIVARDISEILPGVSRIVPII